MTGLRGVSLLTGILFVVLAGCDDRASPEIGSHETASSAEPDSGSNDNANADDNDDAGNASTGDAGPADVPPAPVCASSFGSALTSEFGRIDGTLVGIARPQDSKCAQPNRTHVALDVQINGAAYRFLVNVQSDSGSPDVYFLESTNKSLPGVAWSEGWHTASADNIYLDYASFLDVHSADFTSYPLDQLTDKIVSDLTIGEKISVYATGYGPDGAHDIHKENSFGNDGAVVINPESAAPKWLLFRFDDTPTF